MKSNIKILVALSSGDPHLQCKCPLPCCYLWPMPSSRIAVSEFDPKGPGFRLGYGLGCKSRGFPAGQFPTTTPAKVGEMWPEIDLASLSNSQVYLPKSPCWSLSIQSWPTGARCLYLQLSTFSRGRREKYPQRGWTVLNSYLSLSRSITPLSLWIWPSWTWDSVSSDSPASVNWIVLVLLGLSSRSCAQMLQ